MAGLRYHLICGGRWQGFCSNSFRHPFSASFQAADLGERREGQMSSSMRDQAYRIYLDFLETAENKRHWSIFNDLPWDSLDANKATDRVGQCIELFCAEELYVPDYSSRGMELSRSIFGTAWFQIRWAFEESQHGLAFREYLTRSGLRSEAEFETLEATVFAGKWELPFHTSRQMACYGALQEGATYTAYNQQRNLARSAGDTVLEAIFFNVGRDRRRTPASTAP